MNRVKNLVALFAFSLMVLALPSVASAQWRDRDRDDRRSRNDDYYGRNIRQNIRNIKNRSETFRKQADRSNGNLEGLARNFRDAVRDLEDRYGNGRNMNNSRDEARRVLDIANQIDREMRRNRGNNNMRYEWNQIGNDLDVIAAAYGYSDNRDRRNNRNRGWRDIF